MFNNAKFNQPVRGRTVISLYTREHEIIHQLNSSNEYNNVELEYSNPRKAYTASAMLRKYLAKNKIQLTVIVRKEFVYIIKEESK